LARRDRGDGSAAEESDLHVPGEAVKAEEPDGALDAIEGRVPFDGFAHSRTGPGDDRVETAADILFPAWHRCDVGLHRSVAVALRDLRIAAREEDRLLRGRFGCQFLRWLPGLPG